MQTPRRSFLGQLALLISGAVAAPATTFSKSWNLLRRTAKNPIKKTAALGFMWDTIDPFLFCVHHEDYFPAGNDQMGPASEQLKGRHLGDDFIIKNGFRMYHGKVVPGFPGHPHRGFETITVVRKGLVDHSDSLGASGRYGNGDVQWMTAGKGVQHAEMFPLVYKDKDNTMELFQIWLNLPAKDKMVDPHYKMLWKEDIPNLNLKDQNQKNIYIEVIAGNIQNTKAVAPPPDSWASAADHEVAIWNIKMEAGAQWTLPKSNTTVNRMLYFYEGDELKIADQKLGKYSAAEMETDMDVLITAGKEPASILILQGKPINEPVIQYGPFVMNTKEEINQAFEDYHNTEFGGWPWPRRDQVHPRDKGRFAKHADGKLEERG